MEKCFDNPEEDLEATSKRWLKLLKDTIKLSFKKIRIRNSNKNPKLDPLFQEKERLMLKLNTSITTPEADLIKEELENIEAKIAAVCSEKNKNLTDEYLGLYDDTFEGFSQARTWSLVKKLAPKNTIEPPAAKKDKFGNLITDRETLEMLYLDTYTQRLTPNSITSDSHELKEIKEYLLSIQLKLAKCRKTRDWSISDLENVLKSLKNNKARDDDGFIYELFKYGGHSLKISLLKLFNAIKNKQVFPSILQRSNITSFWKQKGDRIDLDNDRGIFNVSKIRSILDKLVYNSIYQSVDQSMSCSNIGARKNRNIRDHLFVINAIVNDVIHNKHSKAIDLQIYDITKCFDKLEYTNTSIDFFNAGVTDDKFAIITNSNKKCEVAIKTPWGITDRTTLTEIEMQGTVLAGLKCSVSIDSIGKESMRNDHQIIYKYKNCISIPPLSMIDDIIGVSVCSPEAVKVNATIKAKIACKQLELSHKKCAQMHVGKQHADCCILTVNGKAMKKSDNERYLGNIISSDGKNDKDITARYNKGIGYVNSIASILKEISFGHYFFEQAMLLRNAKFINGMLCSIEALHGLTLSHIEKLEKCDHMLMRRIFNSPLSTPTESFYIETNSLPLRFIVIARRLLFYWNIVNKSESELIKQVYLAQKLMPSTNDWCQTIQQDLKQLNINNSESEIAQMKKQTFKALVSRKIRELSNEYLYKLQQKHTKSKNLTISNSIKAYLTTKELSIEEKQLLFQLRTNMFDCKSNFGHRYLKNLDCNLCHRIDNQQHLLNCERSIVGIDLDGVKYDDIFGNLSQQIKAAKIFKKVTNKRKQLLQPTSMYGSQVHQL